MDGPVPAPPPAQQAESPHPSGRRRWVAFVPLTALAAGLLFAASASTAQGTDLRADRRLRLTELIAREEQAVERQELAAAAMRRSVADVSEAVAERDTLVAAAQPPAELEMAAGLVPVRGPALTVSLDDAPQRPGRPALSEDPDDLVVHQQDVQAVVNALWAGGAEAMTIMGQRVVSTSAVRCVGNTLILHGRVYSPPFVISAIGDPAQLREALDQDLLVAVFRQYVENFGLGYDVSAQDEVTLPAYAGTVELPHVDRRSVQ